MVRMLRMPKLIQVWGRGRSSVYNDVEAGLLTKPVRLGANCVGWPDDEVEILNRARIAGKSDDEIRELVKQLEAKRNSTQPEAA